MRKFRLIVDPVKKFYACGIVHGSVYLGESLIQSYDSRPPFKIQDLVDKYPEEWEEVFDWISVNDRPLFTSEDYGEYGERWVCTEDGDKPFLAAIPYSDSNRLNENLCWIHHCVVVDGVGLSVVDENGTEPAGFELSDVTHWIPLPEPPKK